MDVSTRVVDHRAWVEVNLANLVANARTVQRAANGAPLLPMVKANAYGLGALEAVRALEVLDPWGYGVATVSEGVALREAGVLRPIVVFTPADPAEQPRYRAAHLVAVVDRAAVARVWSLPYHLEVDTGMSRCGVRWDDTEELRACAGDFLAGAFTHLHSADVDPATVEAQWDRMQQALDRLARRPPLVHVANSAGAWRLATAGDLVRPGVYLYGGRAAPDLPEPLPVVDVMAPVVSVRSIEPGDGVSYGADWRARAATRIATLGIGYADGIPRTVQSRAQVILDGQRRPVVGRVTMDFVMVDIGNESRVGVGDVATVIGGAGRSAISLDEFASWAATISYEVIARLGTRLERRYRS